MSPVTSELQTVYVGGGRRWLTLKGACRAEAKAKIKSRYSGGLDDLEEIFPGSPFDTRERMVRTLAYLYRQAYRRQVATPTRGERGERRP